MSELPNASHITFRLPALTFTPADIEPFTSKLQVHQIFSWQSIINQYRKPQLFGKEPN